MKNEHWLFPDEKKEYMPDIEDKFLLCEECFEKEYEYVTCDAEDLFVDEYDIRAVPKNYYTVGVNDIDSLNIKVLYKGKEVMNAVEVTFRGFPLYKEEEKINWRERLSNEEDY